MSESLADSTHTGDTGQTWSSGTSLPVGKIIPTGRDDIPEIVILPKLPSHKLRYSVWHDLRQTCLLGDQLHAPRVRQGPPEKKEMFFKLEEGGQKLHHDLKGLSQKVHMESVENWEHAKVINLSYQELQHDYQKKNFARILARCVSAVSINLMHNDLETLNKISFPQCEYLNINNNFFCSVAALPQTPKLKVLTASGNPIETLRGLQFLPPTLAELTLKGCPISFEVNYRHLVFQALPQLLVLDGVRKNASDLVPQADYPKGSHCTIS